METTIAFLGGIASILAILLAFYTIFINSRAIKKMLKEHGEILMKIEETLRYIAELVKTESESLRQEIKSQK